MAPGSGRRRSFLPVPSRRLHRLAADTEKVSRRDLPQVGILRDLVRPRTRPRRQIAFRQCLQPPSDSPKQVFPVTGTGFLLKYLSKFLSEAREARPPQALDFHQHRVIHRSSFPLCNRQPQSHEHSSSPDKQVIRRNIQQTKNAARMNPAA
jgi:hypothetical protein